MSVIQERIDGIRIAFGRLTQREQMTVLAGAAVAGLVILIGIGLLISGAIGRAEARVKSKTSALNEIVAMQGEYRARQQAQEARLRQLKGRAGVRLVKLVEDAGRSAGIDIGQLSPDDSEPNDDGIIESRVDLRANGLSIDRLQDFLDRLENSGTVVIVRRLKINKPYRKETLDVDLTVTTFRLKG